MFVKTNLVDGLDVLKGSVWHEADCAGPEAFAVEHVDLLVADLPFDDGLVDQVVLEVAEFLVFELLHARLQAAVNSSEVCVGK